MYNLISFSFLIFFFLYCGACHPHHLLYLMMVTSSEMEKKVSYLNKIFLFDDYNQWPMSHMIFIFVALLECKMFWQILLKLITNLLCRQIRLTFFSVQFYSSNERNETLKLRNSSFTIEFCCCCCYWMTHMSLLSNNNNNNENLVIFRSSLLCKLFIVNDNNFSMTWKFIRSFDVRWNKRQHFVCHTNAVKIQTKTVWPPKNHSSHSFGFLFICVFICWLSSSSSLLLSLWFDNIVYFYLFIFWKIYRYFLYLKKSLINLLLSKLFCKIVEIYFFFTIKTLVCFCFDCHWNKQSELRN